MGNRYFQSRHDGEILVVLFGVGTICLCHGIIENKDRVFRLGIDWVA